MVSFVDNQEIPLGIEHLSITVGRGGQIIETDADDLTVEKGIGVGVGSFDGLAAFLIEQTGDEVEPAEQFDKPLVHQGLGKYDQGPFGPTGKMQAVQNETGLDGFAQAYFIGEEYTGLQAVGDFLSKIKLMLDKINPTTGEATVGGFANP